MCRYTYSSEVGTYTPTYYGGSTPVAQPGSGQMGYDISADYAVDSTTAYDPRPGGLDALSDTGSLMASVVTTGMSTWKGLIYKSTAY